MPRQPAGFASALALTAWAVMCTGTTVPGAADTEECERTHVRSTDARAEAAIVYGMQRSPTFRSLVDAIGHSDLIVYVGSKFEMVMPLAGEIHFVTAAGAHRYMRVLVRGELSPWERAAMVAHELQHACEVASAPEVRDNASMDVLYQRIGFSVGVDRHETDAARAVTIRVTQELSPGWTPPALR